MRKLMREYGLSIALAGLFLISWIAQAVFFGLMNGEADVYEFAKDTMENWQSEFLQLLTFVVLSKFLLHRDSPQSRDHDDDTSAKIDELLRRTEGLSK